MTISDMWSFLPDCSKDGFMNFHDDGTMVYDEGATKCDPGDPQTETGTWTFTDNETRLSTTSGGVTEIVDIVELTDSKLVISFDQTVDYGDGEQTYTNTVTYLAN